MRRSRSYNRCTVAGIVCCRSSSGRILLLKHILGCIRHLLLDIRGLHRSLEHARGPGAMDNCQLVASGYFRVLSFSPPAGYSRDVHPTSLLTSAMFLSGLGFGLWGSSPTPARVRSVSSKTSSDIRCDWSNSVGNFAPLPSKSACVLFISRFIDISCFLGITGHCIGGTYLAKW